MTIIIITGLALTFKYFHKKPINKNWPFDLSLSHRHYQKKIDNYLEIAFPQVKEDKNSTFKKKKLESESAILASIAQSIKEAAEQNKRTAIKIYIDRNGYERFANSDKSVHRWKMEKHLGRKLAFYEVVHHQDGCKTNNNIENLALFPSQSAHDSYHRWLKATTGNWYGI